MTIALALIMASLIVVCLALAYMVMQLKNIDHNLHAFIEAYNKRVDIENARTIHVHQRLDRLHQTILDVMEYQHHWLVDILNGKPTVRERPLRLVKAVKKEEEQKP